MARATSPADSDASHARSSKTKDVVDSNVESEEEDDGEEGEGEEYEIEAILDAKRGVFEDSSSIGYFVKWKGYDSSENSWVRSEDAEGAKDLVTEFWKRHPKKSHLLTPQSNKKKGSQSTGGGTASEAGRKRGRKSTTAKAADSDEEMEDEEPVSAARASKKARKGVLDNSESASTAGRRAESPDLNAHIHDMKIYSHLNSWESLVVSVDTVERGEDGELMVYFTITGKGGETRVKEPSSICKEKFPQKLLNFYEQHLHWRVAKEGQDI